MAVSSYKSLTPEDYLDLIGVEYRSTVGRKGPQFNIKECPRCGNSDWKVYLNQDNGYGNCFTCTGDNGYNLWTFASAFMDTGDKTVIAKEFDRLAKQVGWRPSRLKRKRPAPRDPGELELPACIKLPTASGQTHKYLEDRGIDAQLCREFDLRYCIDGWFNYEDEGERKGMKFSQRVIIPIYDIDGKMQTFQGRDVTGQSDRKYLFPPKRPGTARFVYNAHTALQKKAKHVAMAEGATDVMALQRALWDDRGMSHIVPVGSFGMHLTLNSDQRQTTQLDDFLRLRDAGLEIITIIWDGEDKALSNALDTARRLDALGFTVRIAFLPKGKDPADVSPSCVRKAIRLARPYSKTFEMKCRLSKPYQ